MTVTGVNARDIRFPTSQGLHGSDAKAIGVCQVEFPGGAAWRS